VLASCCVPAALFTPSDGSARPSLRNAQTALENASSAQNQKIVLPTGA
jgi:hypothetical protein